MLLILQEIQRELLLVHENQLLEKENSGCRALLREDKVLFAIAFLVLTKFLIFILQTKDIPVFSLDIGRWVTYAGCTGFTVKLPGVWSLLEIS